MSEKIVLIPLYQGCQSLDVTGPYEVFAGANRWLRAHNKPPAYRLVLAAVGRQQTLVMDSGLRLQADLRLADWRGPVDTLLVPGGDGRRVQVSNRPLINSLRRLSAKARRVTSVCTGSFLLAEAGLLDGRRATTHWYAAKEMAARYPQVTVDPDPIYVRDGKFATSAGITAGIDLALALVEEDLGREVSLTIARWLVLFLHRPANQRQFSAQLQVQSAERDALRQLQGYIADHLGEDLRVERLAERVAMSPRHFARCFRDEVGMTPAHYVAQLRIEAARRMLEQGDRSIHVIALECGFGTPETLRRSFARALKTAPREYRQRFHAPKPSDYRRMH